MVVGGEVGVVGCDDRGADDDEDDDDDDDDEDDDEDDDDDDDADDEDDDDDDDEEEGEGDFLRKTGRAPGLPVDGVFSLCFCV